MTDIFITENLNTDPYMVGGDPYMVGVTESRVMLFNNFVVFCYQSPSKLYSKQTYLTARYDTGLCSQPLKGRGR